MFAYTEYKLKIKSNCEDTIMIASPNPITGLPPHDLYLLIHHRLGYYIDFQGLAQMSFVESNRAVDEKLGNGLCISSFANRRSWISKVMTTIATKSVSFWVDLSVKQSDIRASPEIPTGDLVLGGTNPKRLFVGKSHMFELLFLNHRDSPPFWMTKADAELSVESIAFKFKKKVAFDVGSPQTVLPPEIYNVVVGPIKFLVSEGQLDRKQNLPKDVIAIISSFAGPLPHDYRFACKHIEKIKGFTINNLEIPKDILYGKIDDQTCILRVAPQTSDQFNDVIVGYHVIKHFHLEIQYDNAGKSWAIVSKRRSSGKRSNGCVVC